MTMMMSNVRPDPDSCGKRKFLALQAPTHDSKGVHNEVRQYKSASP